MTTIDREVSASPGTHALVIGVGHYRHFKEGVAYNRALAIRGTQLTSPPLSARAFADWLLQPAEKGYNPPKAPLATVELLISSRDDELRRYRRPDTGEIVDVEAATNEHVVAAFNRWRDRLWDEPEDVGFFFFSGHGIRLANAVLLLEDFGEDAKKPFTQAFDFDDTWLGMDKCAARRQCFFVDACQTSLRDPDLLRTQVKALLDPPASLNDREGGVFYASAPSREAYGAEGEISYFTAAALDGLNGLGSDRDESGYWVVSPDRLYSAIGRTLKYLKETGKAPDQIPNAHGHGFEPIHVYGEDPPDVPYTVWCDPIDAHALARLSVRLGDKEIDFRAPHPDRWEIKLPPRTYWLGAAFEKGRYKQNEVEVTVVTPRGRCKLPITRLR